MLPWKQYSQKFERGLLSLSMTLPPGRSQAYKQLWRLVSQIRAPQQDGPEPTLNDPTSTPKGTVLWLWRGVAGVGGCCCS